MPRISRNTWVPVAGAWLLCLAGCKATEAQPSGFLQNPELMGRDQTTPFHRTYWSREYE